MYTNKIFVFCHQYLCTDLRLLFYFTCYIHGLYNVHNRNGNFFNIKVIKMLRRLTCSIFWFHLPEIGNRILFIEVLHS